MPLTIAAGPPCLTDTKKARPPLPKNPAISPAPYPASRNRLQSMAKNPVHTEEFGAAPHERPVPRISIHAFCEFPDTGAALQRAGADRRLSKAHMNVQL